jgi:hypothetical protein
MPETLEELNLNNLLNLEGGKSKKASKKTSKKPSKKLRGGKKYSKKALKKYSKKQRGGCQLYGGKPKKSSKKLSKSYQNAKKKYIEALDASKNKSVPKKIFNKFLSEIDDELAVFKNKHRK